MIRLEPSSGKIWAFGSRYAGLHLAAMRCALYAIRFAGYRGLGKITRTVDRLGLGQESLTGIALAPDATFAYPTFDGYWPHYILRRRGYNRPLELFLRELGGKAEFGFVDGGANYGYWSVLISSAAFGSHAAVAVEASPTTFAGLQRNAGLNADRFRCIHAAVSDETSSVLFLDEGRHAARCIVPAGDGRRTVSVPSITITDVIDTHFADCDRLVVKLDVEGAEINAIKGAPWDKSLFVYEDHGNDPQSLVTQQLLSLGFSVFYPTIDRELIPVESEADCARIKSQAETGYDFIALSRDSLWWPEFSALKTLQLH